MGENRWTRLGENTWPFLGDSTWTSIARKMTLYEAFEPAEAKRIWDRLEFHYTPKHGSWLNMVEIEIGVLCDQCLADRIPDQDTLRQEIAAWTTRRNEQHATINWQFTTIDARTKLKRLYPIISKSH